MGKRKVKSPRAVTETTPFKPKAKPVRRNSLDENAKRAQRKLKWACVCSLLFMVAEIVGGLMAGSLAIMTDATHLLSDVAGFCISLFAIWITTLPANSRLSFGFQRAEVIGAITSVLVIWVLTGVLVYAAIERLIECLKPNPDLHVDGKLMFIVACIGLLVNLILMQILGHGHSHGGGSGHGHSHGAEKAHGHSHGTEKDHGHSHGNGDSHGHSHGSDKSPKSDSHGHGHGEEDHGHGHGHGEEDHGHGHGHGDDDHDHKEDGHGHGASPHALENGDAKKNKTQDKKPKKKKKKLENLNIEAAYIHALGDFLQSIGVCIAGGLIWYKPEWQIADPIATFVFSLLVLFTTVGIVRDSVHVLMEGTPEGIHTEDIEDGLRACATVQAIHDLHIWSLSAGLPSLSVHLVSDDPDTALNAAQEFLISKGITHTTIQVERPSKNYARNCADDLRCGQDSPPGNSPVNSPQLL